jgi:hypothetical protein
MPPSALNVSAGTTFSHRTLMLTASNAQIPINISTQIPRTVLESANCAHLRYLAVKNAWATQTYVRSAQPLTPSGIPRVMACITNAFLMVSAVESAAQWLLMIAEVKNCST